MSSKDNRGEIRENTRDFSDMKSVRNFRSCEEDEIEKILHLNDTYNVPDVEGRVLISKYCTANRMNGAERLQNFTGFLDTGHPMEEPDIFLPIQIARKIQAHQIGGIRFMYDNIVGSLQNFSSTTGTGCILAHAMGTYHQFL